VCDTHSSLLDFLAKLLEEKKWEACSIFVEKTIEGSYECYVLPFREGEMQGEDLT